MLSVMTFYFLPSLTTIIIIYLLIYAIKFKNNFTTPGGRIANFVNVNWFYLKGGPNMKQMANATSIPQYTSYLRW